MICCALLSTVLALPVWLGARLRRRSNPLAWRLDAQPRQSPTSLCRPFSIAARVRSFQHAGRGLRFLLRCEHNAWLHLAATGAVIGAGLALRIEIADWRWIIAALVWVWSTEALNTAVEQICNLVSPGPDERVRSIKDIAAGAVLVSAVGAALVGGFTFGPYVAKLI